MSESRTQSELVFGDRRDRPAAVRAEIVDRSSRAPERGALCDLVVSIVNHNGAQRTAACIASLQADPQRRCSVEIVVLDNDSDDDDARLLGRLDGVTVLAQPFRDGFGANHNRVISSTHSRYLLVLNNDTTVPPGTLDGMVDYLDAHPEVGAIGPLIGVADGSLQPAAFAFPSPAAALVHALTLGQLGMSRSRFCEPTAVDWLSGAALTLRRSALERVGLFDEGFFMYHEDTDLCRRLHDGGYEVRCVPSLRVVHDHWGSTAGHVAERIDEAHRSRRRYRAKYHPGVGAAVAPYADAARYGAAALIASAAARLPARLRPSVAREWDAAVFRVNARSALGRTPGRGFRELAAEHNAARVHAREGDGHDSGA